jgi:hypothetical protein
VFQKGGKDRLLWFWGTARLEQDGINENITFVSSNIEFHAEFIANIYFQPAMEDDCLMVLSKQRPHYEPRSCETTNACITSSSVRLAMITLGVSNTGSKTFFNAMLKRSQKLMSSKRLQ